MQNVSVNFSSKHPTDLLLYHFENAYFEWKQKHAVFVHVSLNANELLLPAPFSRIEWGNYDVRTRKSNSPWVPSRFSYGKYNGVFQFISKIKPVVNTT